MDIFGTTCAPPTTSFPTTHFHSSLYLFDRPSSLLLLTYHFFLFLLFHFSSNTPLHSHPLHRYFHTTTTFSTSFFRQDHWKILKNLQASSHLLFEVNISNIFGGFICFCLRFFSLSFDNDIHVIYEH